MNDAKTNLTLVVGYDGSDGLPPGRLERVRELNHRALVIVAVAPDIRSAGMGVDRAGPQVDTDRLLGKHAQLLDGCERPRIETRAAGSPATVLTDIAREVDAQLVVSDARGRFRQAHAAGSVAQRVVQEAPCDVLVVA